MREVTSLIDILFSFTSTFEFSFSVSGGFVKVFVLSADLISLHLDALVGGEDYFSSCLSWRGFCHFDWYPSSWQGYYCLSSPWVVKALVLNLFISKLVNPFASSVCGKDMSCTLFLISSRLCWWVMLNHILVFSSSLPWLTHIILVGPILKLPLLHVAQPFVLCKWYAYCLIYLLALVVCFY